MNSIARRLASLPVDVRTSVLADLGTEDLAQLEYEWRFWARPDQLPPEGDWRVWIMNSGRGAGKTRAAAEFIRAEVESGRHARIAICGPTASSIRRDMVEGNSGLLAIAPRWCQPSYEPSSLRIVWPNGAIAYLLSSEEPDRARGLNTSLCWADELSSWANPQGMWDNLMLGLRITGPKGDHPRIVVSTTPKPGPLLKSLIAAPTTVVTRASTFDNAANLDAGTLMYLQDRYGGTRLGRQELEAELLQDAEGALWSRDQIDACRIRVDAQPENYHRIVIAIDPPGASTKGSAEAGIVVCGKSRDGRGYVLADLSARLSPEGWARVAVGAYKQWKADKIIAEKNFGGEMVEATLRNVDQAVPIKLVTATRGKQIRAEPISALYEQGRVSHVGEFRELENQMCEWAPADNVPSPDRLDALVWGLTELLGGPDHSAAWLAIAERARREGPAFYQIGSAYSRFH